MREIKFRAWDILDNRFAISDNLIITNEGCFRGFTAFENNETSTGLILEQYTGLKDKNGREIYEGDIVSCKVGYKISDPSDTPLEIETFKNVVMFINGEFTPRPHGYYPDDLWYGYVYFDFEVIGNIHENPELL